MRKRQLRHRVLLIVLVIALIAAAVALTLYFTARETGGSTVKWASVVRSTLSSNLSSTGVIASRDDSVKVPVAVLVADEVGGLADIVDNDYTVNVTVLFGEGGEEPILWRVCEINEDYRQKKTPLSTSDADVTLAVLAPVYFDWAAASEAYQIEVAAGTTTAGNVREYVLTLLLHDGGSSIEPGRFPDEFWREDMAAAVTVGTGRIAEMVLSTLSYLDEAEYTISDFTWQEGDILLLDNNLFTVSYNEKFVSFALSEYDVAGIHARMRDGERVYAAVGVNALSGRELIAEVVKIDSAGNSSGVSYFTLLGRLVFPEIAEREDGTKYGDYTYYTKELSEAKVSSLGVNIRDNITEDEVLGNYSTTVTVPKTVVPNTLIVPTKCIYYDDAKRPYVVKLGADGKEKRVYIKITLSTGTDAAVTATEDNALEDGDSIKYTQEAGLISSLF